ncbi:NAD-dependent protein deacetylase sirtuin-1 [Bagarius yarrelli]|uniref:protein acetyllysine N-acetyltransferase n=1 Tax=Bagarius yarrelli TaxID=175774 RepID=A0A556VBR6_BAGYA|nr:NAD-dependent protein deacetylase sirtuin-1 [Bagarius yarrelli]
MATAKRDSSDVTVECDKNSEPVPKKPRTSVLQHCDIIHGGQRTSGDVAGASCALEFSAQAREAEPETGAAQATDGEQQNNRESVSANETDFKADKTLVSEPEGQLDLAVYCNGLHSSELGDDEDDDEDDDCSSHASSSDWTPQPRIGSYRFIQQQIMRQTDPRTILNELLPDTTIPPDLDDMTLWQIIINISEPPKRKKRKDINTIDDVTRLLKDCRKILVLTGAGVSVSCGIPDFRSRDGIYARLAVDFPDLPDPQAMFDIEYFKTDPRPFFKFAKEIYPGQFRPSLCHRFIALLDKKEKILRNYTQNIDTLEQVAGVQRVMQCHGSFATASCLVCKHKVDCDAVREDIFQQVVPHCPRCPDLPFAIMKPDIVFFGENLPEAFHRAMKQDKDEVDLLIVIGSSLKVRPVALIPSSVPHEVPQVLINREPLPHMNFDVELLGDCDVIVNELCHRLGGDFEQLCYNSSRLSEITDLPPLPPPSSTPPEQTCDGNTEHLHTHHETKTSDALADESCLDAETRPGSKRADTDQDTPPETEESNTQQEMGEMTGLSDVQTEMSHTNRRDEVGRRCWLKRTCGDPISKRLTSCQYLFQSPNRYIFHGAEVYSCSEDETSSSSDTEGSSCSGLEEQDSDGEEENTPENTPRLEEEHTPENTPRLEGEHTPENTPRLEEEHTPEKHSQTRGGTHTPENTPRLQDSRGNTQHTRKHSKTRGGGTHTRKHSKTRGGNTHTRKTLQDSRGEHTPEKTLQDSRGNTHPKTLQDSGRNTHPKTLPDSRKNTHPKTLPVSRKNTHPKKHSQTRGGVCERDTG